MSLLTLKFCFNENEYICIVCNFSDLPLISGGVDRSPDLDLNLTAPEIGPTYSLEKTILKILGPSVYNIREGKELALICQAENVTSLQWRKKVGGVKDETKIDNFIDFFVGWSNA